MNHKDVNFSKAQKTLFPPILIRDQAQSKHALQWYTFGYPLLRFSKVWYKYGVYIFELWHSYGYIFWIMWLKYFYTFSKTRYNNEDVTYNNASYFFSGTHISKILSSTIPPPEKLRFYDYLYK